MATAETAWDKPLAEQINRHEGGFLKRLITAGLTVTVGFFGILGEFRVVRNSAWSTFGGEDGGSGAPLEEKFGKPRIALTRVLIWKREKHRNL